MSDDTTVTELKLEVRDMSVRLVRLETATEIRQQAADEKHEAVMGLLSGLRDAQDDLGRKAIGGFLSIFVGFIVAAITFAFKTGKI